MHHIINYNKIIGLCGTLALHSIILTNLFYVQWSDELRTGTLHMKNNITTERSAFKNPESQIIRENFQLPPLCKSIPLPYILQHQPQNSDEGFIISYKISNQETVTIPIFYNANKDLNYPDGAVCYDLTKL